METTIPKDPGINKNALAIGSFLLSLYWVVAVWGFWSNFIYSLGFNLSVFILGMLALFFYAMGAKMARRDRLWVFPIVLIAASFSLWENPFLKVINVLLLPFILSIFFAYSLSLKKKFDLKFLLLAIWERIFLLVKIREAVGLFFGKLDLIKGKETRLAARIILGSLLFLLLAFTVFIPLLSSADPAFAKLLKGLMDWFYELISFRYIGRLAFALVSSILLASYFLSFGKKPEAAEEIPPRQAKFFDPVVSGIVLGGILFLYIVFLMTQLSYFWIDRLPHNFLETERLVKSGFWQLLVLSAINILFFFGYFRKTNGFVQNILKIFTVASFLLLLSAGHRMFLYVFYYGLSYEKFFASYTVLYCAIVFIWLAYQLFARRAGDIFKFLIFSLLWMYSILTVMPVERIIFSTNAALSGRADSRIKLHELRMLSYDALPLVVSYRDDEAWRNDWCHWAQGQILSLQRKKWYEKNFSNFAPIDLPENWEIGKCADRTPVINEAPPEKSPGEMKESSE